uniref:Large ribosomal subunit protein uL4m n=1 Tax=Ostreococcus mediterraneus TaxID=1486918 RepID=A0A7S0XJF4_9CHLO|mmetsp:Transcript_1720/g.5507  ORF Transcript_1720/g.5507 Transcript_1720/m.5507 type:complete len:383 (+) Transcript_1720:29-1177(+)
MWSRTCARARGVMAIASASAASASASASSAAVFGGGGARAWSGAPRAMALVATATASASSTSSSSTTSWGARAMGDGRATARTTARMFASDASATAAAATAKITWDEEADADADDARLGSRTLDASSSSGVMDVRWNISETQGKGMDATIAVYGIDGERRGEVTLPGRIFDAPLRVDIAHRVVRWQRARAQSGLHKTKSRGEVSGTTRKARPQKGQGRARVGNLKAPQMRGGGTAHGPVVRSHEHSLPKKVRRLGLKVALSAKAAEGKIIVVDTFAGLEPKTRAMKDLLERLTGDVGLAAGGVYHSSLIVDGEFEEGDEDAIESEAVTPNALVRLSSRNLPHVQVLPQIGLNVYSILKHRSLILTRGGLEQLISRLDAPINR